MKKLFLTFIASVALLTAANAQNVTAKNVPLRNNYIPKVSGATQVTNSAFYESTRGNLKSSTDTVVVKSILKVTPTSTVTTAPALSVTNDSGTEKFKVTNAGAIYTGTLQGVSTSSFVAGSNTITVTNGIITSVQ